MAFLQTRYEALSDEPWATIEASLREGGKLHAFLSGGGLRVVRVDQGSQALGYGEHPYVEDALTHLAEDIKAGCRPYNETYGDKGCYTSYLTGATTPDSALDTWVRGGSTFDGFIDGAEVVFEMHGYGKQEYPEGLRERVMSTGKTETFEDRGYTFEVGPFTFPGNGEKGTTMRTLKRPDDGRPDHRDTMFQVVKTGRAPTLSEAVTLAFEAEPVEKMEE